jgi:hypothetical protein
MGGKKIIEDFSGVPPIVPGQRVFTPHQFRLLLGGISMPAYYRLREHGLIKFSRCERGHQVVHTLDQYEEYVEYLNTKGVVTGYGNGNGSAGRRNRDTAALQEH